MAQVTDWINAANTSLTEVVGRAVGYLPSLVGAALILIVGWAVAKALEWAIDRVLRGVGLQTLFERVKIEDVVKRANSGKDTTGLIGTAVKWIIVLAAFVGATDVLGLTQVSLFLNNVLAYLPNVVAGALILLVGVVAAHWLSSVVKGSLEAAQIGFSDLAAGITRYAIIVFAVIATLNQLQVAQDLLNSLFTGIVAFLAIAGGLSFGLGGQGVAKEWLEKIRKELEVK
ncbi:hypothetical protein HYU72_00100 [Candidatus Berkelbacteria bacterium]|nr:hypothetical protein [Candidatus Berkelbacteria bacterium]